MTSVLIVDDEPAIRDLMAHWVASLGLRPSLAATAEEALDTLRGTHYDLAVIDVMMPGHDGLWLADQMRRDHPHTAVVIATAYSGLLTVTDQKMPVADFLIKPFQRDRFALAVDRGRQWRKQALEEVQWHARLSIELQDRVEQICEAVRRNSVDSGREADTLTALMLGPLPDTVAHSERVARYAVAVARQLGVATQDCDLLETAARFHDIGKAAMPEALLSKPSPLTPGELAIMRRHAEAGADILHATRTLNGAAPAVLSSHEWFDGGGYPRKLIGPAIPLASRIIAVADAYDAMTQQRAYRTRLDSADAVEELLRCRSVQFDPDVVDAFLVVLGRH